MYFFIHSSIGPHEGSFPNLPIVKILQSMSVWLSLQEAVSGVCVCVCPDVTQLDSMEVPYQWCRRALALLSILAKISCCLFSWMDG